MGLGSKGPGGQRLGGMGLGRERKGLVGRKFSVGNVGLKMS